MNYVQPFEIFEASYNQEPDPSMKDRAKLLRKLIQGKLDCEDAENKDKFDYKSWKKKIDDLKRIFAKKPFTQVNSLNMLYIDPGYLPGFVKFKKK
jgi:hypothetical protein